MTGGRSNLTQIVRFTEYSYVITYAYGRASPGRDRGHMSDDADGPVVLDELSEGVWRETLSSPRDRNALSRAMREAILDASREALAGGARVLIVRGDGCAFSSGYKLDPRVMRPDTVVEDRA